MSYPVFTVPAGDVLPVMFSTYAGATGASATLTGLAVTDIEIYKDGSTTQRASDAGYTLLDTDGIDFDGITGIHGFSIDTGDNTDSGFYTVGAWFTVVVSAVTIDSQTVNFIACQFRLMPAETVAGKPKVDTDTFGGTAGTFSGGRPEVNTTHAAGTAWGSGAITAASIASDAITAAKVAADAVTEIQSGLATAANLATVAGYLDTEIAAILADTNELQTDWANGGRLDLILDARASQTSVDTIDGIVDDILVDTAAMPTAAGIADAVWDEILSGHVVSGSTGEALGAAGAAGDPWITALPGAYSAGQAGYILGTNLNATVSSRSTYAGTDTSGTTTLLSRLTATRAGYLDNLSGGAVALASSILDAAGLRSALGLASANLDTQFGDLPTANENADALLGRNVAGGSSSGRLVKEALYFLRNKWTASGGTLTVYATDDTTSAWTASLTQTAGDPVSASDPA